MNTITESLNEALYRPSCGRCGVAMLSPQGWERNKSFDMISELIALRHLCPACVVDFQWWLTTPPENPDSDSVSSTHVPKGAT